MTTTVCCSGKVGYHGYHLMPCEAEARDSCVRCWQPFCADCLDSIGRCTICAALEDDPIEEDDPADRAIREMLEQEAGR